LRTLGPIYDTDVNALLEFPLDSIPDQDFPTDTAVATLHVTKWPNVPGTQPEDAGRACTVYAGVATYETVVYDFEPGTYYAQVRLVDPDSPYGETVNTEVFRLLVFPSV